MSGKNEIIEEIESDSFEKEEQLINSVKNKIEILNKYFNDESSKNIKNKNLEDKKELEWELNE